jgi:hypothetical protein
MEPKKRSLGAGEQDEFLRVAWRLMVGGEVDAERLVFVDEMGTNVSLSPLYAWSRRGERAFGSTPRNWGKNVTLLASITPRRGSVLAWQSKGPPQGKSSRPTWSAPWRRLCVPDRGGGDGQPLGPQRRQGQRAHRRQRLRASLPATLLSPDLNPIEEAFSKVKGLMRRAEARTREALVEAMGAGRWTRSRPRTPAGSSSTVVTVRWVNCYD